MLDSVCKAENAGFDVHEDLSLESRELFEPGPAMLGKLAQAQILSAEIGDRATHLLRVDAQVADRVHIAATPLNELTFKESPEFPLDPRLMTQADALAAWEKLQADIAAYNARCSAAIVGPLPMPQYTACVADKAALDARAIAVRAKLLEFGVDPLVSPASQARGLPPEGIRPPVSGDLTPGPASRPSEVDKGGQSLWDGRGGEWRYFPGDRRHNPHWDYNPHDVPNSRWQNIQIGGLPVFKGTS